MYEKMKLEDRLWSSKELAFYILKKWKVLVFVMLMGGILFNFYGYYKEKNNYSNIMQNNDINNIKKTLTDEEIESVNDTYEYYKKLKKSQKKFDENYLYQVNLEEIKGEKVQYSIVLDENEYDSVSQKKEIINLIMNAYDMYIRSDSCLDIIYKRISKGTDAKLSRENIENLITISTDRENDYGTSVIITVYSHEEIEETKEIYSILNELLEEYMIKISDNIAKHTLEKMNEVENVYYDTNYLNIAKENKIIEISRLKDAYKNKRTLLLGNQGVYFQYLIGEYEDKNLPNKSISFFNIKYFVVGIILAFAICVLMILLRVLCFGNLLFGLDFQSIFKINTIGKLIIKKDRLSLLSDLEFGKIENLDKQIEYLGLTIKYLCQEKKLNKVALLSSDSLIISDDIIKSIIKELNDYDIELMPIDKMTGKANYMQKLKNIGTAIIIEVNQKSKIREINDVLEICRDAKIELLGAISIK